MLTSTCLVDSCKEYLNALSEDGGECSGSDHKDTKGGTWQVGDEDVSYHALGQPVPPKQDAINELVVSDVLEAQSVNKGSGAPLDPWPLDSLNSVHPTSCHSHNDYDQDIPLFSALSAGCAGVEIDVWYSNDDAEIGHTSPTSGRTMKAQYVDPIRAILDHNNGGSPGSNGVFSAEPNRSLDILVDFKTSDDETLDAVVAALQPLRDGGYLSYFDGSDFVEKQVTVSCSGNAPFDRIASGDGVPDRDVFYDAKVDEWDSKYSDQNSNYASANFKDAIGNPGSVDSFSQDQKDAVSAQVGPAHDAGLLVRYCKKPKPSHHMAKPGVRRSMLTFSAIDELPGDYMWEPLAELGVDRLNADDLSDTARLARI